MFLTGYCLGRAMAALVSLYLTAGVTFVGEQRHRDQQPLGPPGIRRTR